MSHIISAKPVLSPVSRDAATPLIHDRLTIAVIILGLLAIRICYMLWLSPWELVGDEAYYWEWSRHLDWCYYEKGPGLAFLIAPFVKLIGNTEFALRLPMALLSALTAWMLGRLAISISGNPRAALPAVILFCITPAFSANAQLCTQDGPIILIWTALTASGLRFIRRWEAGQTRLRDALIIAAWLGIGFLFKQSILLFLTSFVAYAILRRKTLRWNRRLLVQLSLASVFAALFSFPMILWNARHGWPTLEHTLGHLGAGGDLGLDEKSAYSPIKWFFSLLGTQIGAFGPPLLVIMALACLAHFRTRKSDDAPALARLWMICCALPSIAFFILLSLHKEVLGNWPFPSFVSLIALAGDFAATQFSQGKPGEKSAFASNWKLAKWYGIAGCLVIAFPTWLGHLPFAQSGTRSLLSKMTGHRQHANEIDAARQLARRQTGAEPFIVARYYMVASLNAFYLPDHPTVYCAGTAFGKRPTAYDFWPDTNLTSPELLGRPALLDRLVSRTWGNVLHFDQVQEMSDLCLLGLGYRGIDLKAASGHGGK